MASNPYVNKVEYAGNTIMDISGDTVTPSDVLNGATFHDRSGAPQTGSLITHNVYDGLDSSSTDDALSANQGKQLNTTINRIAIRGIAPVITSSTNNTDFTIASGDYFVVLDGTNDGIYIATSQIAIGATWTDKSNLASYKGGINALNAHIASYEKLGSSSTVTNANSTALYGQYVLNAENCSNLPTSTSGTFYHMLFAGPLQIAFQYSSNGFVKTFAREFSNNQWYPWRLITGTEDSTTATLNSDATSLLNRVTRQSNRVHVELAMTFPTGKYKSSSDVLATLPSGYRPSSTIKFIMNIESQGQNYHGYTGTINSSGQIKQDMTSSCSAITMDFTFMI